MMWTARTGVIAGVPISVLSGRPWMYSITM